MKIAHISTYTFGGAGIAASRLHESLMNIPGIDIDSRIVQSQPLNDRELSRKIERCTHFHSKSYRIQNKLGLLPYFSDLERYQTLINKQPPNYDIISLPFSYYPIHLHPSVLSADIIHLHWTCNFLDYKSFFSAVKQPIVWTLHDIYPFMGIYHFKNDKKKNVNTVLDRIDDDLNKYKQRYIHTKKNIHIVCPSNWMFDQSINSDTFRRYNHTIIPNGLDVESFKKIDKSIAKKILGLDNGKKTIFFGADYINLYGKGLDLLVRALTNLPKDKYNLISVGHGKIDALAEITSNYKHFGFVQNTEFLNLIYSAADVTIIPSREDNLPSMMIESMLNGTPVMSYTNGGMVDHIKTGENGILVSDMTPECLADNITDFLEDKYTFSPNKIRQYAVDRFNYPTLANSYYNLYKSILNS